MGQKVHPYGFRLGYNKDWHSHWFAKRGFYVLTYTARGFRDDGAGLDDGSKLVEQRVGTRSQDRRPPPFVAGGHVVEAMPLVGHDAIVP